MVIFMLGVAVGVGATVAFCRWQDDLIDVINMFAEVVYEWTKR